MRTVTEEDFRMPEFRGKDPKDYEFRADGKVVRKDRWETAIHSIRGALGDRRREFEIEEIVEAVKALVAIIPPQPEEDDEEPNASNSTHCETTPESTAMSWSIAIGNLMPTAQPISCPHGRNPMSNSDGKERRHWTPDEDAILSQRLDEKADFGAIAKELGRPRSSINSRIRTLGLNVSSQRG